MGKPIIGITLNIENEEKHSFADDYVSSVYEAGGLPFGLPVGLDADAEQIADSISGLVLTGGGDVDPTLFGEEPHRKLGTVTPRRDSFELALIQSMLMRDKPILAICRGCQILNVAIGGNIYQDIYSQIDGELLQHSQLSVRSHASHYVTVRENSLLAYVTGHTKFMVNSFHHQAVRIIPKPFIISARASDSVIEAIESKEHLFVLGLQWHPEALAAGGDTISKRIFSAFIEACSS